MREINGNDSHNAGAIEYEKLDKEAFIEFAEKWGYKVNVCDTAEDEDDCAMLASPRARARARWASWRAYVSSFDICRPAT